MYSGSDKEIRRTILYVMSFSIQQLAEEVRLSGLKYRLLSDGRHYISEYMLPKIQTTMKFNTYIIQ